MNSKDSSWIFKNLEKRINEIGLSKVLSERIEQSGKDPLDESIFGGVNVDPNHRDTLAHATLTFGDILYDMARVDPHAVHALDFARKLEIDNIFDFAAYYEEKIGAADSISIGEFSNIKGYVAEQFVATKLQQRGYEVEFPESSNQAGFDLIIDGEPMQVKCGASLDLLEKHFEKYPDIPVIANSELINKAIESNKDWVNQLFAVEDFDLSFVEEMTKSSIDAGIEAFDYEIPLFVAGVCVTKNAYDWWKGDMTIMDALATAAAEIGVKIPLAGIGAVAGKGIGLLMFGPAGGIVFGGITAVASASQSRKIISRIKKWLNKEAAQKLEEGSTDMLDALQSGLAKKIQSIEKKASFQSSNIDLGEYLKFRFDDDRNYFVERQNEISTVKKKYSSDPTELAIKTFDLIRTSKVHPVLYQEQLERLLKFFEDAQKSVKGWPKFSYKNIYLNSAPEN